MVKFESDKKREGEEEPMAGESPKAQNYFQALYLPRHQHFRSYETLSYSERPDQSRNSRSGCEKVEISFSVENYERQHTEEASDKRKFFCPFLLCKESFFVNNSRIVI